MGEFGEITREIKNEKRGKLYCRMVERKDKKMFTQHCMPTKSLGISCWRSNQVFR